jgi:ribulose-5-phosphate 4-epimerase/fuculose-1-phosphate aldolase
MKYLEERKVLLKAIQQMHQIGLIYLKSSNLSVRTPDNYVLIKPSGCSYEGIREEDPSLVNLRGRVGIKTGNQPALNWRNWVWHGLRKN